MPGTTAQEIPVSPGPTPSTTAVATDRRRPGLVRGRPPIAAILVCLLLGLSIVGGLVGSAQIRDIASGGGSLPWPGRFLPLGGGVDANPLKGNVGEFK
jgi:hypothetical protein